MARVQQAKIPASAGYCDHVGLVLFIDGTVGNYGVFIWRGPALIGDPTAYVFRDGRMVWVKPGESVRWIEVAG